MAINIGDLNQAIERELTIYSENVTNSVKREAKASMDQLVKKTKETAPVGHRNKHYRDNITSKKTHENNYGASYTWYVKGSDSRLSHLLEHGHALRDGGRTEGTHFIQNASEPILAEFERKVEEAIKNA